MSDVTTARIGLVIDYVDDEGGFGASQLPRSFSAEQTQTRTVSG